MSFSAHADAKGIMQLIRQVRMSNAGSAEAHWPRLEMYLPVVVEQSDEQAPVLANPF